jgi:hypothetical protein
MLGTACVAAAAAVAHVAIGVDAYRITAGERTSARMNRAASRLASPIGTADLIGSAVRIPEAFDAVMSIRSALMGPVRGIRTARCGVALQDGLAIRGIVRGG